VWHSSSGHPSQLQKDAFYKKTNNPINGESSVKMIARITELGKQPNQKRIEVEKMENRTMALFLFCGF